MYFCFLRPPDALTRSGSKKYFNVFWFLIALRTHVLNEPKDAFQVWEL